MLRDPIAMLSGSENWARMPPAARLVDPAASWSRSRRHVSTPASARWNALLVPMTPGRHRDGAARPRPASTRASSSATTSGADWGGAHRWHPSPVAPDPAQHRDRIAQHRRVHSLRRERPGAEIDLHQGVRSNRPDDVTAFEDQRRAPERARRAEARVDLDEVRELCPLEGARRECSRRRTARSTGTRAPRPWSGLRGGRAGATAHPCSPGAP